MSTPRCPLTAESFHDYFAEALSPGEQAAVEDHVFVCESCASDFDEAGGLAAGLRGLLPPVLDRERFDRLVADGEAMTVTPVGPDQRVEVEFSADLGLLVHVLRVDLHDVVRLDLVVEIEDDPEALVVPAVPFDRDRGEVLIACQRHNLTSTPRMVTTFRLISVAGEVRTLVGTYVVDHHITP